MLKFNQLTPEQQEQAIQITTNRIQQWEYENLDTTPEIITMNTHKDYIMNSVNNLIWIVESDGSLDYELA